jgi:DNA-binding transcriptional MocR family regulator
MTIWIPNIEHREGPRYAAIADAIGEAIASDELADGFKLPPQRDLAWKLGVTVGTISRAYRLAFDRGLVTGEVGRGTYVSANRNASDEVVPRANDGMINLSRNYHPASKAQTDILDNALKSIMARPGRERLLNYMPSGGHLDHRAAGARWMSRVGLEVEPDNVILMCGVQQALASVFASLVGAGGHALCESMTFMGVGHAAALFNVGLTGVEMDDDGLLPEALDKACRDTGARVLITVPTLQNPTTIVMSEERRRAIVEVARRHDLIIVEDDVYGYVVDDRPPPIAALAPERTVYLTGASKCIAPGLRVGWAAAPAPLAERIRQSMFGLAVAQPALTAEIAKTWIDDGTADTMRRWHQAGAKARYEIAADILEGLDFAGHSACFHLFLNLPTPWRSQDFAAAAHARGYLILPADDFVVGRTAAPHAVRISLCGPETRADLRTALTGIRELALTTPTPRSSMI